ncbi:MAG: SDR family oxidoreductase [Methylobacteriaceae bacterium]|nr:SDR family oxidoreductase [Methylobacteriaceae bacterium]
MKVDLSGKVALVTGGSRGIGAAAARALAASGADVAVSYVSAPEKAQDVVRAVEGLGRRAVAIEADGGDPGAVGRLVHEVVARLGRLDILVNNAGVFAGGPAGQEDVGGFDRMFAVNVRGVWAAVQEAAKVMADDGRIISVSSALADRTPFPGAASYGATKAAVSSLTRGWARDLAGRRITVNAVQPGAVETDMNPNDGGPLAQALTAGTALARYAQPDEIAAAIVFLASPQASFITGASLDVDGGFNA